MAYQIGDIFYTVFAMEHESGKGASVYVDQWVLRSISKGKAHLIRKVEGETWVRSKNGKDKTMTWATSIRPTDRDAFPIDDGPGPTSRLARSISQAVRIEIAKKKKALVRWQGDAECEKEIGYCLSALERRLEKEMQKKRVSKTDTTSARTLGDL